MSKMRFGRALDKKCRPERFLRIYIRLLDCRPCCMKTTLRNMTIKIIGQIECVSVGKKNHTRRLCVVGQQVACIRYIITCEAETNGRRARYKFLSDILLICLTLVFQGQRRTTRRKTSTMDLPLTRWCCVLCLVLFAGKNPFETSFDNNCIRRISNSGTSLESFDLKSK